MGKKKSTQEADGDGSRAGHSKAGDPSTSALIICRNKHWRYISSFHGPWLQLPPEVLESLAHANFVAPRPRPIDAAVFFDVVKIRRLVDEATSLAVRATSGLTSAALHSSAHNNSLLGGAAALGMGFGGGGGTLSRERKHRMRELATGKLAAAYRLDEVAASVATMQSASTLEDVAQLVLQRSPLDADARYVHFFHEKIPSRMMAQCTPLDALDDVVAARPTDAAALRTRALTRLFKDDCQNSARDLTEALAAARYLHRRDARNGLLPTATTTRDARSETKLPDDDQPSSLETQLLFHRAGVYLTLACAHVPAALDGLQQQEDAAAAREEPVPETPDDAAARLARAESRKQLRQNAKRALRDYTAFLSHFDYTPGIAPDVAEAWLQQYQAQADSHSTDYQSKLDRLLADSALVPYKKPPHLPPLPPPPVYTLNQLFSAVPHALPPYPPTSNAPPSPLPFNESLTYHPLLPDALHALLLTHALLQTAPAELRRHAHNTARLVRLLSGAPVFLSARSPARADWAEVLRRGGNWVGLAGEWEALCCPPCRGGGEKETGEERREKGRYDAVVEALADERVVDEESFRRAVRARETRFKEDEDKRGRRAITDGTGKNETMRWRKEDKGNDGIGSDRAERVARWVRDAPPLVGGGSTSSNKKGRRKRKVAEKKVEVG